MNIKNNYVDMDRQSNFWKYPKNPNAITQEEELEAVTWLQAHPEDKEGMEIFISYCYTRYHGYIVGITRTLSSKVEAEDIIQRTMLQIFRHLSDFRKDGALHSWISVIATNCVREITRRLRYSKEICASDITGTRDFTAIHARKEDKSTETKTFESDIISELFLRECLEKLPKGYRTVFSLKHIYGLDHNEIARTLQITEGTSKSQLWKAVKKIEKLFKN